MCLADPLGIPAAFSYFLVLKRSRINPVVDVSEENNITKDQILVSQRRGIPCSWTSKKRMMTDCPETTKKIPSIRSWKIKVPCAWLASRGRSSSARADGRLGYSSFRRGRPCRRLTRRNSCELTVFENVFFFCLPLSGEASNFQGGTEHLAHPPWFPNPKANALGTGST